MILALLNLLAGSLLYAFSGGFLAGMGLGLLAMGLASIVVWYKTRGSEELDRSASMESFPIYSFLMLSIAGFLLIMINACTRDNITLMGVGTVITFYGAVIYAYLMSIRYLDIIRHDGRSH